jgi:hypothetical protein
MDQNQGRSSMKYRIALVSGVILAFLAAATFLCSRIGPSGEETAAAPDVPVMAAAIPLVVLAIGAALIAIGVVGLRKKGSHRSDTDRSHDIDEPK